MNIKQMLSLIDNTVQKENNNFFSLQTYHNTNDFRDRMLTHCKNKYDYINDIVHFLVFSSRFAEAYIYNIYNEYIHYVVDKQKSNSDINIDDIVIHFTILSCIRYDEYEVGYGTNYGIAQYHNLIENIITDKIMSAIDVFNIAIKYGHYTNTHQIIEIALKHDKLSEYHLHKILENYKNGSCNIFKCFESWKIYPTNEQYCLLISNGNKCDLNQMKQLNVNTDSKYIIASIISGVYPVAGLNTKTIVDLSDSNKKIITDNIFNGMFEKNQIVNMKKQFNLEYDLDCMLNLCKNSDSYAIFSYLVGLGIKPTVECLCYFIPKHCKHKQVHKILEMSK